MLSYWRNEKQFMREFADSIAVTKRAVCKSRNIKIFNAVIAKHLLVFIVFFGICACVIHFPLDLESEPTRSKYQSTVAPDTFELLSFR